MEVQRKMVKPNNIVITSQMLDRLNFESFNNFAFP
jgi:hypothetical protein